MEVNVSKFRFCNVLPSALLATMSKAKLIGIKFMPEFFTKSTKWWKYEEHVLAIFDKGETSNLDKELIEKHCGSCGECCRDIPTHQIGIYVSSWEYEKAKVILPDLKDKLLQGEIYSQQTWFGVMAVTDEGNCIALGDNGCRLKDEKPLWCKIYHCERYVGKPYKFAGEKKE